VVEDDRFVRESIARLMRSLGFRAEAFASAPDFLSSSQLAETDCLIADVGMPRMTGLDLYRHLLDLGYAIPTLIVTAYPNDAYEHRGQRDGVVCYLRKPLDEQILKECIRAALRCDGPTEEDA